MVESNVASLDLSNKSEYEKMGSTSTSFDDNCATYHICAETSLFIGEIRPLESVGVKGITGISKAEGIGIVRFDFIDDDGKTHIINDENLLYLPCALENLLSISQ